MTPLPLTVTNFVSTITDYQNADYHYYHNDFVPVFSNWAHTNYDDKLGVDVVDRAVYVSLNDVDNLGSQVLYNFSFIVYVITGQIVPGC